MKINISILPLAFIGLKMTVGLIPASMRTAIKRNFTLLRMPMRAYASSSETEILKKYGIQPKPTAKIFRNLGYDDIFKHEVEEGATETSSGTIAIDTGKFTGR